MNLPHQVKAKFKFLYLFLALAIALPTAAYDFPLSQDAIRDAYFLGKQQNGLGTDFLAKYSRSIPELRVDPYISRVRIETPFFQVAEHAGRALNYSAQDAVKEFYGKPIMFWLYLEICYEVDAPLPNAVKFRLTQKNKAISPLSEERSAFFPPSDPYSQVSNLGETIKLELDPAKLDSSTLTILVDTPDGQHAECTFDLQTLR